MFSRAIVREPCRNIVRGISTAGLGLPDYETARRQHAAYIAALEARGLAVTVLPADDDYPDSTFVEDVAVMLPEGAVVTRPGAPARRGEAAGMLNDLAGERSVIDRIQAPGTLEGGDVMMAGSHCYIGLSERTNEAGARQLIECLKKQNLTGSMIKPREMLHLKSGVSYLEHDTLLAYGELVRESQFRHYRVLEVDADEAYAANSLWVNDAVLVPTGFSQTEAVLSAAGFAVVSVDVSEFRKLDGGLSCLSLRF